MDTETYLLKLMGGSALRQGIIKYLNTLNRLMSNSSYELFLQLRLDLDLIEVSGSKFFQISERKFIDCPLEAKEFGKVSPKMFVPFDAGAPPQPKYFKDAIMNSFPEDEIRANFLNKFYQCLLAGRMPHKVRKLLVYGPKDSEKSSWFQVFLGLIPIQYVASITQEKQFSTSMIKQDTQIVFSGRVVREQFTIRHGRSGSSRRLYAKVNKAQRCNICFK